MRRTAVIIVAGVIRLTVLYYFGDYFLWRPETTTGANSGLKIKEGIYFLKYGLHSPYDSYSCHAPPLVLWFYSFFECIYHGQVFANFFLDVFTSLLLTNLAKTIISKWRRGKDPPRSSSILFEDSSVLLAESVGFLYILNPLTILSCLSGSSSSLENFLIFLSIWAAVKRLALLSSIALAAASMMSWQQSLLLPTLACLFTFGPLGEQSTLLEPCPSDYETSSSCPHFLSDSDKKLSINNAPTSNVSLHAVSDLSQSSISSSSSPHRPGMPSALTCLSFNILFFIFIAVISFLALIIASDAYLISSYPAVPFPVSSTHPNLCLLDLWLRGKDELKYLLFSPLDSNRRCWLSHVWGFQFSINDVSPSLSHFWYIFMEVFEDAKIFFRIISAAMSVSTTLPTVLIFGRNCPLFALAAQLSANSLSKGYPSIADVSASLTLLPLLWMNLKRGEEEEQWEEEGETKSTERDRNREGEIKREGEKKKMGRKEKRKKKKRKRKNIGSLLALALPLLAVLWSAMHRQWLMLESANSNFLYSISLIIGVWQTMLFSLILRSGLDAAIVEY